MGNQKKKPPKWLVKKIIERKKNKKKKKEERLPLLVMYANKESWYVEDDEPIAIYLKPDEVAVYLYDLPRCSWSYGKNECYNLTAGKLFWRPPTFEELQLWNSLRGAFDKTAHRIGADGIKPGRYWSSTIVRDKFHRCYNFKGKEVLLDPINTYAHMRPFLRLH